ncbi:MAG TPA: serine hydrolase domain-containing protein [Gaiellaceae bacterium]|nr:serine hydrolase domain-containing protein [Gaiellaceae bacterium]
MDALRQVEGWPCEHAAVAVTGVAEASVGDRAHRFPWASVTKVASAVAFLVAAEEGIVDLDEAAGPPGSTFRHLLAHASGLPFDRGAPIARPGARRIYSNYGFEVAAAFVAERAGMPFTDYFAHVWGETTAVLSGSAGSGVEGTLDDLLAIAHELREPTRIAAETLEEASTVQFPGLVGVLPGFGAAGAERLGARRRDTRSQVATLDGGAELAADVRPLRPRRHVPVGRPRRGRRARVPHRPRVRRLGRRGVAAPRRLSPARSQAVAG